MDQDGHWLNPSPAVSHREHRRFFLAVGDGNVGMVRRLIERVDVDAASCYCPDATPLAIAVERDDREIVALLISHGANYKLLDEETQERFIPILLEISLCGINEYIERKAEERKRKAKEDKLITKGASWIWG